MNRFEAILEEVKYFSKLIGHMHMAALEINKTQDEIKLDFINSKRTGQCAVVIQNGLMRVGAHHIPNGETEEKIRFSIIANNKINFLLENLGRINTFPQNEEERIQFELKKVFGGGIKTHKSLPLYIAVSGFHPKIDEACSIVIENRFCNISTEQSNINQIQRFSEDYSNPYALAIACGSGFIKGMSFEHALYWGKDRIK